LQLRLPLQVATHYAWFLDTYDGYQSAIQRADAARYFIAHRYGGFYLDLDYDCSKPLADLVSGYSLVLSYKLGGNFSRGVSNSIFGSSAGHPFWQVVFDVLRNRSGTPLDGHHAVLHSTGPAVLREALRRLLRLPQAAIITAPQLQQLREQLGIVVLDASLLHPVTAERRVEAKQREAGADNATTPRPDAFCTHHFVSSWVAHSSGLHAQTERRRQEGHDLAAMEGTGQPILFNNTW